MINGPENRQPTEAEIVAKQLDMYADRVRDINGTFKESFTEADDSDLKRISDLILADETPAINEEIGCLFRDLVEGYCFVSEDDAIDELKKGWGE